MLEIVRTTHDNYWFHLLQPTEMSLEEIEERLSSVVKSEIISQLKSSVWKECLECCQDPCVVYPVNFVYLFDFEELT